MKYAIFLLLVFFSSQLIFSQDGETIDTTKVLDSRYREDQFYLGVTYNALVRKPSNVSQTGFSSGFHFGFLRDMPLNTQRNVAIALGLGLSINSYNQNILVNQNESGEFEYINLNDSDISADKNRFNTYLVEFPLEFRWRTSTAAENKFWRIYTGFKLGYVFANKIRYEGSIGNIQFKNVDAFDDLQYGITLSAGYSTWNFHVYYSLNPIFSGASINGEAIDMYTVKLGLMFYIL